MPKFNRVSLLGSEELFRPTRVEAEAAEATPAAPQPAAAPAPAPVPTPAETISGRTSQPGPAAPGPREHAVYRLQLSKQQVQLLAEAVQKMKYPGQVRADQKPSIEEFEALEQLRKDLLNTID
jgi:hypothetical protein